MRHLKKRKKLNRDYDHRRSLVKNLVRELFIHGKIKTTASKARFASRLTERLINRIKRDALNGRRNLFAYFQDQHFVNQVADKIAARFKDRPGGITRIKKLKRCRGNDALLVVLEFVDGQGGIGTAQPEAKVEKKAKKEVNKEKKVKELKPAKNK